MEKFKNDTYVLLTKISDVNEKVIQHVIHPQDAALEVQRLIQNFADEH